MQLMQMIESAQMQDSEHFLPQGNSQQYGYSYPSQHSYQYIESGNGTKLSKSLTLFSKHVQIIVYSNKGTRYHVTSF